MEIRNLFIGLLLFSLVVIGISNFYGELATNYGVASTNITYIESSQKATQQAEAIHTATEKLTSPTSITDFVLGIYSGLVSIVLLPISLLDIFTSLISNIGELLGLPTWFMTITISSIIVIVIFEALSALLKWKF